MQKNENVVEGFSYRDPDLYRETKKEADGVRYMKSRVDFQYPQQVHQIYCRMIEQEMFQTQVGYAYLQELQDYLRTMPQIPNDEIPPIPVGAVVRVADASGTVEALRADREQLRHSLRRSVVLNVVAAAMIVVMFAIAFSSSSPTVLNYENRLIDKYSAWQQELEQRETVVQEKERVLLYGNDGEDTGS